MGCAGSGVAADPEQRKRNLEIEKELQEDKREAQKEIKLLLLGAGASGKSTIAKQMKLLYMKGFSEREASIYTEIVFFNLIKNTKAVAVQTLAFGYELLPENRATAERFATLAVQLSDVELTEERINDIRALWDDPACAKTMERSNEFQMDDNAPYFYRELERITAPGYKPSVQDILHVRAKTIGITETEFVYEGLRFRMVDVGGQRTERRKWIHAFNDVTAILFVLAISEYDQVLEEDGKTSRMQESLKLFGDMINLPIFRETDIILFLNKKDIFEEKIKKRSLRIAFPKFKGKDCDYDAGISFITKTFQREDKGGGGASSREIYVHQTCATDTENVRFTFQAASDIMFTAQLQNGGFY